MAIIDDIKLRHGNQLLVELTRNDVNETTIDDPVLQAAIDDSVGIFERETGVAFDEDNRAHVPIIVSGTMFHLESWKMRNAGIISDYKRDFLAGCKAFKNKVYISPATNSQLKTERDTRDSLPDMHRNNFGLRQGKNLNIKLTND